MELEQPYMNYLRYNRRVMVECLGVMFEKLGLTDRFKIDQDKLHAFLEEVANNYKLVPYHNFLHAFNLAHFNYWLL